MSSLEYVCSGLFRGAVRNAYYNKSKMVNRSRHYHKDYNNSKIVCDIIKS